MGTIRNDWKIDHEKFRVYLKDKYNVENAYYFMGYFSDKEEKLYIKLETAGFKLIFFFHNFLMNSLKKGNVDSDIIFNVMKNLADKVDFNKVVIVSGDGDYFPLIEYLIEKNRFCKIMFPNRSFASSLYKKLSNEYFVYLDRADIRVTIEVSRK